MYFPVWENGCTLAKHGFSRPRGSARFDTASSPSGLLASQLDHREVAALMLNRVAGNSPPAKITEARLPC
jgi:hypothetical protein